MTNNENFIIVVVCWVIAAFGASMISGGVGSAGRDGSGTAHSSSVPADVKQITQRAYFVTSTDPQILCRGSEEQNTPVEETRPVPGLGTFVLCHSPQTWGAHKYPPRPNFGAALGKFWTGIGGFIFDGLLLATFAAFGTAKARIGLKRSSTARYERKRRRATLEEQRASLGAAYARDEITQEQFEQKLEGLLKETN